MNREEKLDGYRTNYTPEYNLYFFFTGQKPLELGFVLYEDKKVVLKQIMGTITEDKILDKVWEMVETYLKDKELTMKVIREVSWKNPNFFRP
jgi:hypothetical protein